MSAAGDTARPLRAVVTGAASGIGAAVVARLTRDDWSVVGWDIMQGTADGSPHRVVDVADADAVHCAARELTELDLLVNCAGVGCHKRADELTPRDWDRVIAVDLSGTFYCCNALYAALLARRGVIVNIASIVAHRAGRRRAVYCTAKAGVVMLTQTLAADWGPHGIRVNAISPGYTHTPMVANSIAQRRLNEQTIVESTPLGRLADPPEVAEVVYALTTQAFAFMNGATLIYDGGWTADGGY